MTRAANFSQVCEQPEAEVPSAPASARPRLRLVSYNIQVGVASSCYRHYVTRGWKHVLPHATSFDTLDRIADLTRHFDVVALQEVDGGSLRSFFINQVEYLAHKAQFPFWYHQTNRDLGRLAQHSNGLLTRIMPTEIVEHKLPGLIPGRGAMMVRYGEGEYPLVLLMVHLALSQRARMRQLDYISEIVNDFRHVALMGDLNCLPGSLELRRLFSRTHLQPPDETAETFPSWRPMRKLDYILTSDTLAAHDMRVLNHAAYSDHLPIAVELELPDGVALEPTAPMPVAVTA